MQEDLKEGLRSAHATPTQGPRSLPEQNQLSKTHPKEGAKMPINQYPDHFKVMKKPKPNRSD